MIQAADKSCSLGGKLFRVNQDTSADTSWQFCRFYQIYSAYTVFEAAATDSKGFRTKPGLQE